MAFHGLFIGIDRYASPAINWLNCARRDATALEAQFFDTLGGATTLLLDGDATRSRIASSFEQLATCSADDTVVIAFSGHGTEQHQLVTFDADPDALPTTGIPLDELTSWFARIPARHLVLLLDCCFSGGAGAKVLKVDAIARDLVSVDARLARMAGEGRLIVTASGINEPAWESQKFGHGYFTYFLLEAMRGAHEAVEAGRLPVYRLLQHVTRRVVDVAHTLGHAQNPTLRGSIDGDVSWPIFTPGPKVMAAFPEHARNPATADLASLAGRGFPAGILDAWAAAVPTLNSLQIAAINEYGILDGENLVVVAPTSSGKTMVGELAALRAASGRKRAAFLLPLKALVADKRRHFAALYAPYGVRVVEATGESDDVMPIVRGQYDIGLFTYEKFASLVLTHAHVLDQVSVIVVDEVQMLADKSRGANLEFLMTVIAARRREGSSLQVVALSGVVGDTNGLERWLGARKLRREERPVPLDEGIITGDGRRRYLDGDGGAETQVPGFVRRVPTGKGTSQEIVIPLVRKLVAQGQQVIVFREQVSETRGCANYLAGALGLPPAQKALDRVPRADQSMSSTALTAVLGRGVAFHNSHLSPDERRIVEEEFRARDAAIKVIVATTTLAMGVNTPASSVVIVGLEHPGEMPYSVAEYKNLVGRAGRLGLSERGASYLIAMTPRDEDHGWMHYVKGRPEELLSRFLDSGTDPRSLIVRMLVATRRVSVGGLSADDIASFLEGSFGVFQQKLRQGAWAWNRQALASALADLVRHGLVEASAEGLHSLTELGSLAGETGIEVASVIRLVDSLRHLQPDEITDPALIAATQQTLELDGVNVPMNKKTLKEAQTWLGMLRVQGIVDRLLACFSRDVREPHEQGARAKRTVAALAYVSGQDMTAIEQMLRKHGGPGWDGSAGPIRSISTRTCDIIGSAARIAEILHPGVELCARCERLRIRLNLGIPASVVDLGREAGQELSRGDYLALAAANLTTSSQILAATDDQILACVENNKNRLETIRAAAKRMDERIGARERALPDLAPYAA